jgi:hypothetical protein
MFMVSQPEKVVFMHLPKTAGVTINNLLSRNYPRDQQFWFITRNGWGEFVDTDTIQYIHGHFDAVTAARLASGRKLVTFVRDPVSRTLSEFYYWKSHTDWYIESENLRIPKMVKTMPLRDFLNSDIRELRLKNTNFMTKAFAGFDNSRKKAHVDEGLFNLAVNNLEKFDHIGLVENMPASVARLLDLLGIQDSYTGQVDNSLKSLPDNKYYEPVERDLLSSELCELLLANHAYDIRLYELIKERFH